jgi:hypothetical protein
MTTKHTAVNWKALNGHVAYKGTGAVCKRAEAFRLRRKVGASKYAQSHTSIPISRVLKVDFPETRDMTTRLDNMSTSGLFASVREFHDFHFLPTTVSLRLGRVAKTLAFPPDDHGIVFTHVEHVVGEHSFQLLNW